ncbi:hypothetical protein MASR1M97_21560 [Candidatus Desulfobacillus denitrificans]
MTNTLPDFSERPELRSLAEVVRALREAGDVAETDCLLIGAAARDLWLRHGYSIEPGRETRDVDFGVAVADWAAFSALCRRLVDSGEFVAWPGAALHRLRHRSGAPTGIVPLRGVGARTARAPGQRGGRDAVRLPAVCARRWSRVIGRCCPEALR